MPQGGRSPRLPFFSLSCVLRPCRYPYPADWPVSFDGSSTGHASLRPFCRDSAVSDIPLTGFREGPLLRRQFSRYVAACTLARAPGQSPLDSFPESNRLARLRQSLLQQGSPPTNVCYYYSAQPSIAEAGFAPAHMSKTEGCTQKARPVGDTCRTHQIAERRPVVGHRAGWLLGHSPDPPNRRSALLCPGI